MSDGLFVVFGEVREDGRRGEDDGEELLRRDPEALGRGERGGGAVKVGGEQEEGFKGGGDRFG